MKPENELGAIQIYGRWLGYCVGFIPETHKDIIPYLHLDPTILEEATAKAWLLTQGWKGHVSIRPGTLEDEQMQLHESTEATGEKEKYTLTADDNTNTMAFMKAVMRKITDEVYDHRLQALNVNVSELEFKSWDKQKKDYIKYTANNDANVPLLEALATARGIEKSAMAILIRDAINSYDDKVKTLLTSKQATEKLIKDCASLKECFVLLHNKFEYTMPVALATELSITDAAQFDV
jgi:hypothetical protein